MLTNLFGIFFGAVLAASVAMLVVMVWRERRPILAALGKLWEGPRVIAIYRRGRRRG